MQLNFLLTNIEIELLIHNLRLIEFYYLVLCEPRACMDKYHNVSGLRAANIAVTLYITWAIQPHLNKCQGCVDIGRSSFPVDEFGASLRHAGSNVI